MTSIQRLFTLVQAGQIDSYFSFFTDITYMALTFYFIFASCHTLWYSRHGHEPLNSWYRPFQLAHTVLFSTIVTFPIVVTVVFWSLLRSSSTFSSRWHAWANISKHALNSAFALFEIIFAAVGMRPWSHMLWIIVFLGTPFVHVADAGCYVGVAYITHATQGIYVYSFLNPSKGAILAAYIIGILVGSLVVFALVNLVMWLLAKATTAKQHDAWRERYEMSHQHSPEDGKSY